MLNTVFQLTSPRRFEVVVRDERIREETLVVRPTHLSICNADQRYYQGTRSAEILAQKLPMALIHEAIGEVVFDPSGVYSSGDMVALVPNLPSEEHPVIAENYLRSSRFRASSADGFMQELMLTTKDRVVRLPAGIDKNVLAFTELVSVSWHVVDRFERIAHADRSSFGVWGDGNVGFITALLLRKKFPKSELYVFGRDRDKLSDFTFATQAMLTSDIPQDLLLNHAFECAGGVGSIAAIDQAIDHIHPEGTIALMGVAEDPVPINTRMVLEKGLRIFGSSRSGRNDFAEVLAMYAKDPTIPSYLSRIVGQVHNVNSVADMTKAFEADIQKRLGKTVMLWNI